MADSRNDAGARQQHGRRGDNGDGEPNGHRFRRREQEEGTRFSQIKGYAQGKGLSAYLEAFNIPGI